MRELRMLSIVVCLATCVSCIWLHGPEDLRHDLASSAGVELHRETGVTVGRLGLAIARLVTKQDEIPLKGVRKVEVGVYEVVGTRRGVERARAVDPPEMPGYEHVVRIHDEGDDVFVMVKFEEEQIRRMLVIVAEEDEWVLVRIRGKLNHIFEQAMEMAFDQADKPELYEPALADYRARQADEVDEGEG
jgi:hypothetical protein